jgi:class 3 adenylate cyclase/pimeloyl-ACP methyl ester carboxylesterase
MATPADTSASNPSHELAAIMFSDIAGYTAIMGRDEQQAIRALQAHRGVLRTLLPQFNGRLIGEIGDGTLSSFHSAIDAVNCARAVQERTDDNPELKLRIGIHLGDVLFANQTVLGDGVNVASRIHALAPPGGICLSSTVYDEIRNKPGIGARDLGDKQLKNVSRPIKVYLLAPEGGAVAAATADHKKSWIRRAAIAVVVAVSALFSYTPLRTEMLASAFVMLPRVLPNQLNRAYYEQKIAYCTTSDGLRIAYSTSGQGPPVVYVITWATDLEHGSGTYGSVAYRMFGTNHTVIQYDGRGFGASDRGVRDFSVDARLRDLEAVVDTLKLKRFALWGYSAGGPVTIAYTARHPERVTRLLLQETYANYDFNLMTPQDRVRLQSLFTLLGTNFSNTGVLDLFVSYCWPEGTEIDWRVGVDILRGSGTPEDFENFLANTPDVTALARQIRAPTLIVHFRNDQIVPVELGKQLATLIPGSRLVILEGRDHVLPFDSSAFQETAQVIRPYVDEDRLAAAAPQPH